MDERSEEGEEGKDGARLSVTQSDDPRSGGHFALGMSKTPLQIGVRIRGIMKWCENVWRMRTYPRSARERGGVVIHGIAALHLADRNHARSHVGRESPISNGLTTVAGEMVE